MLDCVEKKEKIFRTFNTYSTHFSVSTYSFHINHRELSTSQNTLIVCNFIKGDKGIIKEDPSIGARFRYDEIMRWVLYCNKGHISKLINLTCCYNTAYITILTV